MDGASIPYIEIAQNKALHGFCSASPHRTFSDFIPGRPVAPGRGHPNLARVAAWGGGFPIKGGRRNCGAIGLSGAPIVQNDVDCAKAALALDPMRSRGLNW